MTDIPASGRTIGIWHDEDGQIVAWGYVPSGAPDYVVAEPVAGPGRGVLSASVAQDELDSLHESYVVDVVGGSLRRRSGQD